MHQMVTPPKLPFAFVASERLLALVDEHVSLELVRIGEGGVTEVALVRLFAGVNSQVSPQVCDLNKLSIAVGAVVRLLSSVQPHVRFEMVIPREPFVTDATLERFFTRVSALVVLQDVLVPERPIADFAGEDFVPTVVRVAAAVGRGCVSRSAPSSSPPPTPT
jgi:hypothetical protein